MAARAPSLFSVSVAALLAGGACDGGSDVDGTDPPGGELIFDGSDGPPPLGAVGYCGNQLVRIRDDTKSLFFVIDASSSMRDALPGSEYSRFDSVRLALADVLLAVGHRLSYGAAVFPGGPGCTPGAEVFPTTPGDPANYGATGTIGPVLAELLNHLVVAPDASGTPLSATLAALTPTLAALEGTVSVVIATDGHPNCNPDAACGLDDCYYNMLAAPLPDGRACDATLNCCDADVTVAGMSFSGPAQCVDGPATLAAVQSLSAMGVNTYVLGLPDAAPFESLLNELSVAGGTARDGAQKYYPIADAQTLSEQLRTIGADFVASCDLELDSAPPDPKQVNVYLDRELLPADPASGWAFTGSNTLAIRGAACTRLESGEVLDVQIVAGCPTQIR